MADKTKDLKKKLFSRKKNGWDRISAAASRKIDAYCKRYMAFLDAGKTSASARRRPSAWRRKRASSPTSGGWPSRAATRSMSATGARA